MRKLDQRGSLLVTAMLVISLMLLLIMSGFAFWAYGERSDYKNKADQKIAAAVEVAKKETATQKDNQFAEDEKKPYKTYQGPGAYGSVTLKFPKTWSAFVQQSSSTPLDGYFHPGYVPGLSDDASYAFRLEVSNQPYSEELKSYDSAVKSGSVAVQAYKPAAVPNTVGARLEGEIQDKKIGVMVMIPLRDKTLKIWTESQQFVGDFNAILSELTFVP